MAVDRRLMEVPRSDVELCQAMPQVCQMASNQMDHFAFALDDAFDHDEAAVQHQWAEAFQDGIPDDDVRIARLVFQRHKDDPGCGARALSASDDAGNASKLPVTPGQ